MLKRQGDLLIIEVKSLPEGAAPEDGLTLARGEATGHAHRLDSGKLSRARDGRLFFVTSDGTALRHEEHAALFFGPGVYEVRRQREYSPQEVRRVMD